MPSAPVDMMSHGATHCGAMCLAMMRTFTAPIERAASTYCDSFTASTCDRTTRLARGICTMPIAMMMFTRFVPRAAVMASASISVGIAMSASIMRCMALSTLPPYQPLMTPMTPPAPDPKATEANPTSSEMRAPAIMRLQRSRPISSVPSQWLEVGPSSLSRRFHSSGSHWVTIGPTTAMRTIITIISAPAAPSGFRVMKLDIALSGPSLRGRPSVRASLCCVAIPNSPVC